MPQDRTRKIIVAGVMGAITILLGATRWGFLPWFSGISITIMCVPVIIGAVLEGPIVGAVIGLIFGVFSLIQAAVAPITPSDALFINPLLSVLPRLFIGPVAWLVWRALKRWQPLALIGAGIAGSLTNTLLVLGMFGLLKLAPWSAIPPIILVNGLPEAGVAALITLAVVSAWWRIQLGRKKGSTLE